MLISDLKKSCLKCAGSGFQAGYDEWGSIKSNLRKACPACSGKGYNLTDLGENLWRKACPACSGKGYNLTDLGENLWKLYRPMLQELIREELQNKSTLQK